MFTREMKGWLTHEQDSRRAIRWLLISIAIHLPFTPLGPLFGLLALITHPEQPAAPIEELHGIPVELLEQSKPLQESKADIEPVMKDNQVAEARIVAPRKNKLARPDLSPSEVDAGLAEDAGNREQLAPKLDASAAEVAVADTLDAGTDASTALAKAPPASSDEALAAATGGIADSNANIRISLFMDRVRQHPMGSLLGHLLKSVYQWRDFFEPGGLDPVNDFDQILVFGPQLRDSSQVAAFLKHNVRASRIRGAIDSLVKKSGSGSTWLKGTKYPAARAVADRALRLFVLYPGQVVAVVPPKVEKDALALPAFKLPSASDEELASVYVKTPWRALLGTGLQLSKTICSAQIKVYSEADGSVRIEATLEDESGPLAQQDAGKIKRDVDAVTLASNWLFAGSRFAEPVQIRASDSKIQAILHVTRAQADRIFAIAESVLTPEGRREVHNLRTVAIGDAGTQLAMKPVPVRAPPMPDAGD